MENAKAAAWGLIATLSLGFLSGFGLFGGNEIFMLWLSIAMYAFNIWAIFILFGLGSKK